jgi:hypothetical protein
MNRTILTCAGLFCLFLTLQLLGQPSQRESPGPGFSQRYLVLATMRTSTLQKELRQAAAAGYRVLAGWSAGEYERKPDSTSTTSAQFVMLLEKAAAPPNVYEYLLLSTLRSSTLQKELREAAARGFRLLPHTIILNTGWGSVEGEEIVLVMEKAPASSNRYDYLVLADPTRFLNIPPVGGLHTVWLDKEDLNAVLNGYSLVGIVSRSTGGYIDEEEEEYPLEVRHVLFAEKLVQPDAGVTSQEPPASARERYIFLVGRREADLQEPLIQAAARGYRLRLASHLFPQVVLVMEKVDPPGQAYQYLVVGGENQLSAAAAIGFHPHPAGVFGTDRIVMEKAPGSESRDKYFFLEKTSSSALQDRLADASAEGLNVVATSRTAHLVLLQKAAGQVAESPAAQAEQPPPAPQAPSPSRAASAEDETAILSGSKVYVHPMDGFETNLIAAFKKKKLPLLAVLVPEDADYEILGSTKIHEASMGVKVLEAIGATTAATRGEEAGDFPRKLEVKISVRNVRTGAIVFEHTVTKRTTARALPHYQQSAADDCAKELKKKIVEPQPQ